MSRELESLHQQLERLGDLQQQLKTVNQRIGTMEAKLPELEQSVQDEQADVDRMESGGITSFVYGILGRQKEKLEKERREARQAQEQYQAALNTLQDLHRQRETISDSIAQLGDLQRKYQQLYEAERQKILQSSGSDGQRLRQLEEDGRQLRSLEQELIEARDAGDAVMDQINRIRKSLDSASTWGTVDLFTDGFFADMAKYSHMDDAQAEMQELNRLLRRFSKELKDVDTDAHLSADIGSGMRFADFFFDGFFTDAMALSRIDRVKNQVEEIASQVQRHLDTVSRRLSSVTATLQQKSQEAQDLILHGNAT